MGYNGKTLGFIKRNLKNAPEAVRKPANKVLWNAVHHMGPMDCQAFEQNWDAARVILKRYHRTSSMGAILTELGWETLKERRTRMSVVLLYKATDQLFAVKSRLYVILITAPTHQDHSHMYQRIVTKSNYKYLFYPCTNKERKKLPASIVKSPDLELFKAGLGGYSSPVALM